MLNRRKTLAIALLMLCLPLSASPAEGVACNGCTWCVSGRKYQAQGDPGDLDCPTTLRCDLGCSTSCDGCTSISDCRSDECSGDYVRRWSCSSCQCTKTDTLCADSCKSKVNGGCYESDCTCVMSAQGTPTCTCSVENEHDDGACTYTSCSGNCKKSGTYPNYGCSGGSCTYTSASCSADCAAGTVCSGGSCSTGNCGTTNCPSDYCSGNTFYNYPSTCSKYCDGSGSCGSCTCSASTSTCSASGCCAATCSATGGCGTTNSGVTPQTCTGSCSYKKCDYSAQTCDTKTSSPSGTKACKADCTWDTCSYSCPSDECSSNSECACRRSGASCTSVGQCCSTYVSGTTCYYQRSCEGGECNYLTGSVAPTCSSTNLVEYECASTGPNIVTNALCSSSNHFNCQSVSCGGSTYYCTYDGASLTWAWRTSKPAEVCNDGSVDNDCDGLVDEDCGGCTKNVGLSAPDILPSSPSAGDSFYIECPTSNGGWCTNCVHAYADGDSHSCGFNSWAGDTAVFSCSGMDPGTYTAKCSTDQNPYSCGVQLNVKCCEESRTKSYTVADSCIGFSDQLMCQDAGCEWCTSDASGCLNGKIVTGAKCRSSQSYCQYEYALECGTACLQNSDCTCDEACTKQYPNCQGSYTLATCNQATHTCVYSGASSNEAGKCADKIDNDCDGVMDCSDAGECPPSDPACSEWTNVCGGGDVPCDAFLTSNPRSCRASPFENYNVAFQGYCCYGSSYPVGSGATTYCCYTASQTKKTGCAPTGDCVNKQLAVNTADGNFCSTDGWECEYNYQTVECCNNDDCAPKVGEHVPTCRLSDHACEWGSQCLGSNSDCYYSCCSNALGGPDYGNPIGTCKTIGSLGSSNKYLCVSASPLDWHVCEEATAGEEITYDGSVYICQHSQDGYAWETKPVMIKTVWVALAFTIVAMGLILNSKLIKLPGRKKKK